MGRKRGITEKSFDAMTLGLFTNELVRATDNFSKKMVVREYGKREQQKMEKEGAKLMDEGYMMVGQSGRQGFWNDGKTRVTYVKHR